MNKTTEDYRFEVKVPIPLNRLQKVQHWLQQHPMGFARHHAPRNIYSLYLDTPHLESYEENLSGISKRRKVRIRWYGDLYNAKIATLEFKHRQGGKGYKSLFDTSINLAHPHFNWQTALKNAFYKLPITAQIMWGVEHSPIIICSYLRHYFVSYCGQIRATMDYQMCTYDQRYRAAANLDNPVSLGAYALLELKTAAENEAQLSELIATCPLRPSRHSKYVNSIRNLTWY